jgi:polyferredoxin
MGPMDRRLAIRAALTQAAAVAVLSIALAIPLPHSFFVDYGWIVGPGAWALSALFTAQVLGLPRLWSLLGAAVAGLPSLVGVLLGAHWLGAVLAIGIFGVWCGFSRRRTGAGSSRTGTSGTPASWPAPAPGPEAPSGR